VSVDGLRIAHDFLRNKSGSFSAACAAIEHLRDAQLMVGVNTQINRLTAPDLPALYELLRSHGVKAWQLQLTVPSGNAADHPEILLQPCELIDVFDMVARLAIRALEDGISIAPGNNLGYHGPFEDLLVAAGGSRAIGEGCLAGRSTLGIEADGTVKGCPSLPRAPYAGRNIRVQRLREMLDEAAWGTLHPGPVQMRERLWGFCRACEFAESCQGGCTWTAQALLGRPGNNPYCHHRALTLAQRGLRERIRQVAPAPGVPFDHGVFELIEESSDAPWPPDEKRFTRDAIRWPPRPRPD
jgi:radical SAM protein with 4Fe4S-binding SPASM domain